MKKYYNKQGKAVQKPSMVSYKGYYIYNPDDSMIKKAGYEIREEEETPRVLTNDEIKVKRQRAYKATADLYLIAYQAYTELGEHEKAAEMKELWIQERNRIDKEYPYITE